MSSSNLSCDQWFQLPLGTRLPEPGAGIQYKPPFVHEEYYAPRTPDPGEQERLWAAGLFVTLLGGTGRVSPRFNRPDLAQKVAEVLGRTVKITVLLS